MTGNEIIKYLKSILDRMMAYECSQASIGKGLVEDIISMYDRQKAEIENQNVEIDILIRKKEALRDEISTLSAEVERLKEERDEMHGDVITAEKHAWNLNEKLKTAKSEAIREFAERFNSMLAEFDNYDTLHIYEIKDRLDILKEMVGDSDA